MKLNGWVIEVGSPNPLDQIPIPNTGGVPQMPPTDTHEIQKYSPPNDTPQATTEPESPSNNTGGETEPSQSSQNEADTPTETSPVLQGYVSNIDPTEAQAIFDRLMPVAEQIQQDLPDVYEQAYQAHKSEFDKEIEQAVLESQLTPEQASDLKDKTENRHASTSAFLSNAMKTVSLAGQVKPVVETAAELSPYTFKKAVQFVDDSSKYVNETLEYYQSLRDLTQKYNPDASMSTIDDITAHLRPDRPNIEDYQKHSAFSERYSTVTTPDPKVQTISKKKTALGKIRAISRAIETLDKVCIGITIGAVSTSIGNVAKTAWTENERTTLGQKLRHLGEDLQYMRAQHPDQIEEVSKNLIDLATGVVQIGAGIAIGGATLPVAALAVLIYAGTAYFKTSYYAGKFPGHVDAWETFKNYLVPFLDSDFRFVPATLTDVDGSDLLLPVINSIPNSTVTDNTNQGSIINVNADGSRVIVENGTKNITNLVSNNTSIETKNADVSIDNISDGTSIQIEGSSEYNVENVGSGVSIKTTNTTQGHIVSDGDDNLIETTTDNGDITHNGNGSTIVSSGTTPDSQGEKTAKLRGKMNIASILGDTLSVGVLGDWNDIRTNANVGNYEIVGNGTILRLGMERASVSVYGGEYNTVTSDSGSKVIENDGYETHIDISGGNNTITNHGARAFISDGTDTSIGSSIMNTRYGDYDFFGQKWTQISDDIPDHVTVIGSHGSDTITNYEGRYVLISGGASNDILTNKKEPCTPAMGEIYIDEEIPELEFSDSLNLEMSADAAEDIELFRPDLGKPSELVTPDTVYVQPVSVPTPEVTSNNPVDPADATIYGGDGDDTIFNEGSGSYLSGDTGVDVLHSTGSYVTMNGGEDNDSISNKGDRIYGHVDSSFVSIIGGIGNDSIENSEGLGATIYAGEGDDFVENCGSDFVQIDGGNGNDTINNRKISCWNSDGCHELTADFTTINGGFGTNLIQNEGNYTTFINEGGTDYISGFKDNSMLRVYGTFSTYIEDSNLIVFVENGGRIILTGATDLSSVNIQNIACNTEFVQPPNEEISTPESEPTIGEIAPHPDDVTGERSWIAPIAHGTGSQLVGPPSISDTPKTSPI